jgi:hypothetical protein
MIDMKTEEEAAERLLGIYEKCVRVSRRWARGEGRIVSHGGYAAPRCGVVWLVVRVS